MTSTLTSSPSLPIGIDLGTTYCCVAVLRHPTSRPEVLENDLGKNTTPSYVAYSVDEDEGEDTERDVYAGETAKDLAYENPENTIFDTKRLIGRSFHDPNIQKCKQLWPFHLVNIHGFVGIKVHGETLHPQIIATKLISHLKKTAEDKLGHPINSAVVTVPVYFTHLHTGLTREACEKAGFKNTEFILEPVAAAIAYGFQTSIKNNETKTCLIFDIGGGTFDVTIFQLGANEQVEIKATGGDDRLGGEDFNDLLTQYCIDEFKKLTGVNLVEGKSSDDPEIRKKTARRLRRIRNECEKQKCFLASTRSVVVSLDGIHEQHQLVVPVTRRLFEDLIDTLLTRSIRILDETVKKSGFEKEGIDDVILIGGSSRILKVQQLVQEYFEGKKILRSIDADEAVACGAAIQAHKLFKEKEPAITNELSTCAQAPGYETPSLKTEVVEPVVATLSVTETTSEIDGFPGREFHAAVAVNNKIYSFGGITNDPTYSSGGPIDVFVLNTAEMKWRSVKTKSNECTPNQRYGHTAVAHKECIIILGGYDSKKAKCSNTVYRFHTESQTWDKLQVTGNIPEARCAHSSVLIENKMITFGGFSLDNKVGNMLHALDLNTFKWSIIQSKGVTPKVRAFHSAVVYKSRFILFFGGKATDSNKRCKTLISFDLLTNTWTQPHTWGKTPSGGSYRSAFMKDGLMYVFGVFWCSFNLFSFNPDTKEWKELIPSEESYVSGAVCVLLQNKVFIFGGIVSKFQYSKDTFTLEI